jgi:16S rRNA (guanine(966)-N(2))-methyltransferase RsmD
VREALFSILTPRVEGARFLDLFAGTGANGIEALSRGAASATFVDNDPRSIEVIRRNLDAARLSTKAEVRRLDLPRGLSTLSRDGVRYAVVFADAPYGLAREDPDAYLRLLEALGGTSIMTVDGIAVIEHDSRVQLPENATTLTRIREARYGGTTLSLFSWGTASL